MAKGPTKSMWARMLAIMLVVVIALFGTTGFRLVKLMVVDAEFYQQKAIGQQLSDVEITPQRGDIYDRQMSLLASSTSVWTAYIAPNRISGEKISASTRQLIIDGLVTIYEMDREAAEKSVNKKIAYEIVRRQVEEDMATDMRQYIKKHKLGSYMGLDPSSKRNYPHDELCSAVLGFVGTDNKGLAGLESQYDSILKGVPGRVMAIKNGRGEEMPFTYNNLEDVRQGNSLVLTIDHQIQSIVDRYLEEAVKETGVKERATIIAMDVNTGGILAMSTKSDFDPNRPFYIYDDAERARIEALPEDKKKEATYAAQNRQWRNKAVSDAYEPGSVYKIVTGAAAIEERIATLNSTYGCPGYIKVADRTIGCANRNGHGHQTLIEAYQHSCNPAFISMGLALGGTLYNKYYNSFGITAKTGIDLPGEAAPIVHSASQLKKPVELATTSFGQTFKITPIQMITAISAAVNGGQLMKPRLVDRILDEHKNVVKTIAPEAKRQVISKETSDMLRMLMEKIVEGPTASGHNAYVAGYHIGGKTGTSEKRDTENPDDRISSFCGVAPANNPQIALLVILDDPQTTVKYGGTLAAPIARNILGEVLPLLGVEPDYTQNEMQTMDIKLPNLTGKALSKAKADLDALKLKVKVEGDGANVERQVPGAGQSIPKGGSVVLYTSASSEVKTTTVPKLTGLTVAGVNAAGVNSNLNILFRGSALSTAGALSVKQSEPEGKKVEIGTVITVEFVLQSTAD